MPNASGASPRGGSIRLGEFVALIALLIALTALAIDIMLVALPEIAQSYRVAERNDQQLVITAYLLGFAAGQPLYGPLSDRFGRKPVLSVGLVVFAAAALWAIAAPSFGALLAARALQGFGAAAPRIVAIAIVRDRFAGREMARVMSFVMMVFIIVPILAPSLGQGIVRLGAWPWVFAFLFLCAGIALAWATLRLPETRAPEHRLPLSVGTLARAFLTVVTTRRTLGYTVALGFIFGNLMAYIGSAQQVFVDVYGLGDLFPVMFGAMGVVVALASFTNARLVRRLGMRRLSHTALVGYITACGVLAAAALAGRPPLLLFALTLAFAFFFFGLITSNFNALAMEPLGQIAGMASSVIGCYISTMGALFGWIVGQAFDGSVTPLALGFASLGLLALFAVLATERGRLQFRPDDDMLPRA